MENGISTILRNKAVLSNFRLTVSGTGVEYWVYSRGFLEHARESGRVSERTGDHSRREDNLNTLRNNIRRLVNANVDQYGFEPVFLTFTYEKDVTDVSEAWRDWEAFMRRMRARYGKQHALTVMEFQDKNRAGVVHFHCIFFNLSPELEANEKCNCGRKGCDAYKIGKCQHQYGKRSIAILWRNGYVDIERVRSAKNVGAYVCSYLDVSAGDSRLIGKKFYSTTRNLFHPELSTGEFAQKKYENMMNAGALTLLAETSYEYAGAPVTYRNYKFSLSNYVQARKRANSLLRVERLGDRWKNGKVLPDDDPIVFRRSLYYYVEG